jgi:plasmid stability protein
MRYVRRMARNLQVRDIPDRLHRELKRRAKARGIPLTDYVQGILEREIERPPAEEVFERIRNRPSVDLGRPAADIIREERPEQC